MFIEKYADEIKKTLTNEAHKGVYYAYFYINVSDFNKLSGFHRNYDVYSEIISYWINSDSELKDLLFEIDSTSYYGIVIIKFIF